MTENVKELRMKYNELIFNRLDNTLTYGSLTRSVFKQLVMNVIRLISVNSIPNTRLDFLIEDSNEKMDYLLDNMSPEDFLIISHTLIKTAEELIEDCLELEMYEACGNIKNFYGRFYRNE